MQTYASEQNYIRGTVDRTAMTSRSEDRGPQRRASGLGWFSIGLGLAEMFMPKRLGDLIGIPVDAGLRRTMFGLGLREIGAGLGLLGSRKRNRWMWSRVAGDLMDLALLGSAFSVRRANRGRLASATAAVGAVTLLDALTARQLDACPTNLERKRVNATSAVTIHRSPVEVETAWAAFRDQFSLKHGDATFRPAPGGRGTEMRLMHGKLGARLCQSKLRQFKQMVEIGEVIQSDSSIHGGPHAAQPSMISGQRAAKGDEVLR